MRSSLHFSQDIDAVLPDHLLCMRHCARDWRPAGTNKHTLPCEASSPVEDINFKQEKKLLEKKKNRMGPQWGHKSQARHSLRGQGRFSWGLKTVTLLCQKELVVVTEWGLGLCPSLHSCSSFRSQKHPLEPLRSEDSHPWAPTYSSVWYQHNCTKATRSGREVRKWKECCMLNSMLKYRLFQRKSVIQNSLWRLHGVLLLLFLSFF